LALAAIVSVSYLAHLNFDLLQRDFAISPTSGMPVYSALLIAFLLGFLPTVGVLLTQTLRRDLAERRARRRSRQEKSVESSFRRAADYRADGQWGRALDELDSVLADQPEDFSALLLQGEILRRSGRPDEALEVHRRASVLYPRSVALLYELAEDYRSLNDLDVAEEIEERVLRDFSGLGLHVLQSRRDRSLEAGEWDDAGRLQERVFMLRGEAVDGTVEDGDGAIRIGLAYQRAVGELDNDRFDEAERTLKEILDSEPRFVPGLILRGEMEALKGRSGNAVSRWRKGFEETGSPVFLQRIEDHFIERGQPIEAIDTMHQIINACDSTLVPRFFLGRLFYRLEMHDEALRTLEDLTEEITVSPTYHLLLARIHHRRGEMAAAAESYLMCVKEAGLLGTGFVCRACRRRYPDWRDRCDDCGSWNSVELNFELEKFSAEDLGLRQAPVRSHFERPD